MTREIAIRVLSVLALLLLAGCVSPEQLRAEDEAACTGYGFRPGTTDFATCLQNESLARQTYWSTLNGYDFSGFYGPFGPWGLGY